jgi:peptidoglycan/LPS O-acetylase OafA/YrhL
MAMGRHHYAVLDGLRGLAALVVLLFHIAQQHRVTVLPRADLAVDFFYILSGFVVAYAYDERLRSHMTFRGFMAVRVIRLYPLLFAGVAAGIGLAVLSSVVDGTPKLADVALAGALGLVLLPSYVFPQWSTAYPFNMAEWSLFFEFFVNALYAAVARHLSTVRLVVVVGICAVVLIGVAMVGHGIGGGNNQDNWGFGFGRVLFPFFCGVLLYRLRPAVRNSTWAGCALMVVLGALLLSDLPGGAVTDLIYVMVLLPILVWCGAAVDGAPRLDSVFLLLGRLSYPVYILQGPIIRAGAEVKVRFTLSAPATIGVDLAMAGLVLAVAYGALKLYDEPVRAALTRLRKAPFAPAVGTQPAI